MWWSVLGWVEYVFNVCVWCVVWGRGVCLMCVVVECVCGVGKGVCLMCVVVELWCGEGEYV